MFNRILLSACTAGILAALVLAAAQAIWVTPLIMQAEEIEDAAQQDGAAEHQHAPAWQPENGWQRTLATLASNSAMGIGYALMLCGMYALRKPASIMHGLGWGLAGYFIFFAAPAGGLPPELPGTASAELAARQYWWLCTSAATAGGLALIFLQSRNMLRSVGAVLIILPHLVGAPHPAVPASLAPEELQTQFRLATIFVNTLFWMLLGLLSVAAFRHFSRPQDKPN